MAWSRNTTWRQGSVLSQQNFESVGLSDVLDANLAIAISHDCDIANDNLNAEPAVEFVSARIVEKRNGNYTYGKNPRTLHLDYKRNKQTIWIELIASRKIVVKKELLTTVQPDLTYRLIDRRILQNWLAVRYRRLALPNSLVERLRGVSAYIEKHGKKNSAGILSFRLSYDPKNELPPEEPYELWLSIVYILDEPEYATAAEDIARGLRTEFTLLLEKTKDSGDVDLRRCEAVSETEFTLRDMRDTVEYNLEYLSYRIEPSGPVI